MSVILTRSKKDLTRLVKQIDHLAKAISALPPISIGKLNGIIAKQNWQNFDTEMFFELMQADAGCAVRTIPNLRSKQSPLGYW